MPKRKILLRFPASVVKKPLTYHLIKDFDLVVNIFNARITAEDEGELGIEIEGSEKAIEQGISFLEENGVRVSPLSREIKWSKEKCYDCGACIGICPQKAIYYSKEMSVEFDKEKCIACGLCIDCCPRRVISSNF